MPRRETWYVLESGDAADPNECAPNKEGILMHKSGVAVAMRGGAYSSRGVDPDEERAEAIRKSEEAGKPSDGRATKDMKPDDTRRGYRTRESKAG